MKKSALLVLSLAAITLLGSCGGSTPSSSSQPAETSTSQATTAEAATITSVSISGGTTVELGSTLKLSANVQGTGDFSRLVDWASSDRAILTINDTGLVTPVAAGKATVTATSVADNTKKASVEITVTEKQVVFTNIGEVNAGDEVTVHGVVVATNLRSFIIHDGTGGVMVYLNALPEVEIGDVVAVEGTLAQSKYANGLPQFDATATVIPANGEFNVPATVDLTAEKLAAWKALLPASADDQAKQFIPTTEVKSYKWTGIAGSGEFMTLNMDGSDVNIQPVYQDAEAFPLVAGSVYELEGYFAGYNYHDYAAFVLTKAEKKVSEIAPETISISAGSLQNFYVGDRFSLTVTALPAGANDSVTWVSENADVASVNNGVVSLLSAGTAIITAASTIDPEVTGTFEFTVAARPEIDGSTAEKAFTPDGLIDYINSTSYDANAEVYVKGTITSASYNSQYSNWTIDLKAENGVVELYRAVESENNLADFRENATGLVGYELLGHGKSLYYASGKKYELNTGCIVDSVAPGEALPTDVDLSTAGTVKTVAEVKAASDANKTELVRVTGVAENLYGTQYGNFYVVDPATGVAAIVYGGYTDITYTELEGVYTADKDGKTVVTSDIIGKVVTVVGLLGSYKGVGQVVDALVTADVNQVPGVHDVTVAEGIENGTVALSKTEGFVYGEEITVTATPASGYKLAKLTLTDASGKEYDITEAGKFKVSVKNVINASFAADDTTVVSKTVADLKTELEWTNGTAHNSFKLDQVITISKVGGNGDSKYYDSGSNWRNYFAAAGDANHKDVIDFTFAAAEGYKILSVKATFTIKNDGMTAELESGVAAAVNDTSKTFRFTNTYNNTNQALFTAFEVAYQVVAA